MMQTSMRTRGITHNPRSLNPVVRGSCSGQQAAQSFTKSKLLWLNRKFLLPRFQLIMTVCFVCLILKRNNFELFHTSTLSPSSQYQHELSNNDTIISISDPHNSSIHPLHGSLSLSSSSPTPQSHISNPNNVDIASDSLNNEFMIPLRPNWNKASAPSFCQELFQKPKVGKSCSHNLITGQCNDGPARFMSVDYQDYYLYTRHFKHLKRRGSYIDIATNDPITGSNTFIMDVCLGWEGVCVEANPIYLDRIRITRSCHLIPTCVSDKDGQKVSFALAAGVGGILDTNKHAGHWKKMKIKRKMLNLTCRSMAAVQKEKSMRKVDYLSLDVEGHELNVLKGFSWDDFIINVITVEISTESLGKIESFLNERGYVRHFVNLTEYKHKPNHKGTPGTLFQDAIFLHNTVKFGHPE